MPAFSRLRLGFLEDLARELRFASREALTRDIARAQTLARELMDGGEGEARELPVEWVLFRLTGYRPSGAVVSTGVALVRAGEVLSDLSALVERLSAWAELESEQELRRGGLTLAELTQRWGCDRKTIERARRRGLIAMRTRGAGGRATLVFAREIVEAFERARRQAGADAENRVVFSRLTEAERGRARRCAGLYLRVGLGRAEVIARVARRLGRARGTVRAVIAPMFKEARPGAVRLSARVGRVVDRLLATGREAGDIARRVGVTRRALLRAAHVYRAQWLMRLAPSDRGLAGPVMEAFARPDAAEVLLAPEPVRAGLSWEETGEGNPPIAFVERTRLVALQFLKFRARGIIAAIDRHDPASAMIDEALTLVRWAALLRLALVRQELGTITRTLATLGGRPSGEVVVRAVEAARGAIDAADPASEGRLAAGVTLAVTRALAPRSGARGVMGSAGSGAEVLRGWSKVVLAPVGPLVLPAWVRARARRTAGEGAAWLIARHGLAGAAPRSMAELARERGWSWPRAVAFERAALRAVRAG
ncbi:MAG: hypothetical protein SFY95_01100 [Planctomycetota bacterium]|nr:hypothetical protein [Planctomycetota bacterium]